MRLLTAAFLGQAGEPFLQARALWQRPPQCSLCTVKFVIYQHIGPPHSPQTPSVAGGDFVGWGKPSSHKADNSLDKDSWWWWVHLWVLVAHFSVKTGLSGGTWSETWLLQPVGSSLVSLHRAEGLASRGEGPEVTAAHPRQTYMPQSKWWQLISKKTLEGMPCCSLIFWIKYYVWWLLVKKDTRENQEKHGSNFLDKRRSSLHGKHVKDWKK